MLLIYTARVRIALFILCRTSSSSLSEFILIPSKFLESVSLRLRKMDQVRENAEALSTFAKSAVAYSAAPLQYTVKGIVQKLCIV